MTPSHTPENTRAAYPLNWSLSLFGTTPLPDQETWSKQLAGVLILSAKQRSANVVQFFLRTKQLTAPSEIVRTLKARLQYLNSPHVVLENADGWNEIRDVALSKIRGNIRSLAKNEGWSFPRIELLSNHIHILLGAEVTESPQSLALWLMNRVAAVFDGKPWLKFSFYVGTFGGYDRGAIRVHLS
jgi:REP element-mobilizing transposase RayT